MHTSVGFRELDSMSSHPRDIETLTFMSKDLRLIRWLLRLLSLWRPGSAGIPECYMYPVFVNLVLLSVGLVRNTIQAADRPSSLSIQSVYVVHDLGIWLGHILGNFYFRSRDLETNVFSEDTPPTETTKPLKRKLKYLRLAAMVSFLLFSIMLCTLYVVSQFTWNHGRKRFSADLPSVHGTLDHFLYAVVIVSIVYNLGIGLALAWTMGLLSVCYASRLKALEELYLTWKRPSVDAVFTFQQVYARPVRRSWKRISWWFIVHNIIVLAVPLYGYEMAQAFSGNAYHSKHLPQFICYLVFVLTVWLAPIVLAEQIKRREKKFQERINDLCPGLLKESTERKSRYSGCPRGSQNGQQNRRSGIEAVVSSDESEEDAQVVLNYDSYTLASRGKELRDFLRFLEKRRYGLVSHGYTLQLNLSLVSLFIGIVSFLIKLHVNDEVASLNANRQLNYTLF